MPEQQLRLERRSQDNQTPTFDTPGGPTVMLTPPINEDYWEYRVVVGEHQAVVGFPKFTTIGIGFAVEEDWNTNLPYTADTDAIWRHIAHNKGDDAISDERCIEAIALIQAAAHADRGTDPDALRCICDGGRDPELAPSCPSLSCRVDRGLLEARMRSSRPGPSSSVADIDVGGEVLDVEAQLRDAERDV